MQLKRKAKLPTMIGLTTKHAKSYHEGNIFLMMNLYLWGKSLALTMFTHILKYHQFSHVFWVPGMVLMGTHNKGFGSILNCIHD